MTKEELISELKEIRRELSRIGDKTSVLVDDSGKYLRQVRSVDRKVQDSILNIEYQTKVIEHGVRRHYTPECP